MIPRIPWANSSPLIRLMCAVRSRTSRLRSRCERRKSSPSILGMRTSDQTCRSPRWTKESEGTIRRAFVRLIASSQNEPCHSLRRHGRSTSASGPAGPAVGASGSEPEAVIRTNRSLIARSTEPERFRRLYHSNTSSARESKDLGIVSPSAFQRNDHRSILRLIAAIVLQSHLPTSAMDCQMRRCYVGFHTRTILIVDGDGSVRAAI